MPFSYPPSGGGLSVAAANTMLGNYTGSPALPTDGTKATVQNFLGLATLGFVDVAGYYSTVDATGATNTLSALQTAINTITTAGRGIFLNGTLELGDGTLTVPANAQIFCGPGCIVRRSADPVTPAPMIAMSANSNWTGGELRHTALGSAVASAENCAIRALGVAGVTISRILVTSANKKWQVGVSFQSATKGKAIECTVTGARNRSYYVYLTCTDITLDNCIADGATVTDYGFNINPATVGACTRIIITNSTANQCSAQGFEMGDQTYDSLIANCVAASIANTGFLIQQANGFYPQYNNITGCTATNCTAYGFQISDTFYNQLTSCAAKACGTGLYFNLGAQLNSVTGFRAGAGSTFGATQPGHGLAFSTTATRNDVNGLAVIANAGTGVFAPAGAQLNIISGRSFNNTGGNVSISNPSNDSARLLTI
jgi:Right handed beta helix region